MVRLWLKKARGGWNSGGTQNFPAIPQIQSGSICVSHQMTKCRQIPKSASGVRCPYPLQQQQSNSRAAAAFWVGDDLYLWSFYRLATYHNMNRTVNCESLNCRFFFKYA